MKLHICLQLCFSSKLSGCTIFAGYEWILSNAYQMKIHHSPAALHQITRCAHMQLQLQALPLHLKWARGNTVNYAHEPMLLRISSLRPWKGVSLNIKKGNGGLCLCDWPTRINRTGGPGWISALPSLYLWEIKEDAAVVAISPLTLFVICLQALICFTDVARAPPPPFLWPNV